MADGTYRFQQPGAGPFYFQTQPQQHSHQRHTLPSGTNSPGRLKFNHETPSPSRSPPVNQSASLNPFNMYGQGHQGQHVMMNGGQAHQRFGMQVPKFQSQNHHPHHAQQQHHHTHHTQATHTLTQHHTFSAGALSTTTPHFTPTHLQNGAPNAVDDMDDSMNEHWQHQLQLAAESRQANSPHYYARVMAQQSKGIQILSSQADASEQGADGRNGTVAGKTASRQGWNALDFGGQGLRAMATSLFSYGFLEKLYLNHNKLKALPSTIGQLRKLTHLDLSGNELTELPEEIGMLSHLKKLYLFDNNIRNLPYEMGYLYRLETLGIEGNPLDDVFKSQIMKDGTKALIKYLKEEMPVHLPPPDRDWVILDETASSTNSPTEKITVLSYNTLCDNSATEQQYGYAASRVLSWEFRRELILNELRSHNSDIVCLQEVDKGSFNNFFREQLAYNDYKGIYWPRGRASRLDDANRIDGCAIFFKSSKYILLDKQLINFSQSAVARPEHKGNGADDIYNRLWLKDHIAVVVFLENRQTGTRFIVVNCHLYWDPAFKDVKLIQAAIMMEDLTELAEKYAKWPECKDKAAFRFSEAESGPENTPTVEPARSAEYASGDQIPLLICGDLNSSPGSAVHSLINSGQLSKDHSELDGRLYGRYQKQGMKHPFKLKSTYGAIGELSFTNYTPDFKDILDYMWYTTNTLHVSALLGEVDKDYLSRVPGFPNFHFPSDHVALFAEYTVKGKKGKVVEADFGPQRH
ncbi:Glucose-repressible alcohol dehydrogenase transcriptional effector [Penicillium atrosanguineum]|uniref:transcriptional regulator sdnM n=1 Tax=Penicillium atrosanguineum TaxID=1132637 RepID=UPI0023A542A6|nr:transcriptional regulator sdnM [Penicillium atrosanguineum]KAJ5136279.1 Glucose-repressible alcohol dehydrogenase transcriptional effector [Penicillium atrosanguineum]KAJ5292630.1 transcriptional regulator sdnM [Penicillium atrosanguineum]